MLVYHTSHFEKVITMARNAGAASVSIQNYYTFCNFESEKAAMAFQNAAMIEKMEVSDINTQRPFVPFEIRVRHPR